MYWKYNNNGKEKGCNNSDDCKIRNITLKIDAGQRQKNAKRKKYWTLIRSQDFGNKKLQCVISIKEEKYRNDERMQIQI